MAVVDDSFKRPGAVPFKWEIQPGVPKAQQPSPRNKPTPQKTPPKLSPPPSGISFYPPHHSTLLVRVTSSQSKSSERHRRLDSRPNSARSSVAVAAIGCFPSASPRRRIERKVAYRSQSIMKSELDDIDDTHDLQTLARWSVSSQKPFSPFNSSSPRWSASSQKSSPFSSPSPSMSPFRTPQRAQQVDAEWAAYGLF